MSKPEGNQPSISSFFNVTFNIVHEDWSIYTLEGGSKLRTRVILVSLKSSQLPVKKGVSINIEYQVITKADVPPNSRGPSGHPALPEEISDPVNHGGQEVSVISSTEPWNEYIFENGRIKLKLVLNKLWRLNNRYDNTGDPVYITNYSVLNNVEFSV